MEIKSEYKEDIDVILSHRNNNGSDLWTNADKNLLKGSPFTTIDCTRFLLELGMDKNDPLMRQLANLLFSCWKEDGRFRAYASGGIYPCQTAYVLTTLCYMGYSDDERIHKTFQYFLDTQEEDGGWKCNKYSFGRGPETEYSTPITTLEVLDAFCYTDLLNNEPLLDKAVEFLLEHWVIKMPISPCHYGIGKLFKQVEYPFRGYNIFYYLYVLSHYNYAKKDKRFLEALEVLKSNTVDEQIVVQRVVPKLAKLNFCKKGEKSELATKKYNQILYNLNNN